MFLKVSCGRSVHLDEVEADGVVSLCGDWSSVIGDVLQALQNFALTSRKHIVTQTTITCSMIQLMLTLGQTGELASTSRHNMSHNTLIRCVIY